MDQFHTRSNPEKANITSVIEEAQTKARVPKPRRFDSQPIKSAMRTLALLEHFRCTKMSASVTEISTALGIPQSSSSVLLKSLLALNYLEYDPQTRRFLPSYRVALLGDWIQRARFGNQRITDVMELLQADTGETVMLAQQIGVGLQYLHVVPATYRIQFMVYAGDIRPISRTGLGQVLLSHKSDSQIRAIVRRNNADEAQVPPHFRETALIEEIEAIRQRGYAETRGRTTPGANTIGMLVRPSGKQSLLAIGIGGPIDRVESKRLQIIDALRRRVGMAS
jgi:DNA-binding IclR family transcriptional regulator